MRRCNYSTSAVVAAQHYETLRLYGVILRKEPLTASLRVSVLSQSPPAAERPGLRSIRAGISKHCGPSSELERVDAEGQWPTSNRRGRAKKIDVKALDLQEARTRTGNSYGQGPYGPIPAVVFGAR